MPLRISAAVSNSAGFDSCVTSPVWTTNAGGLGNLAMVSPAAGSVVLGSGFASLLNPIWLSLICTKEKLPLSAAIASPPSCRLFGTPPTTVHTRPVPAQAMHCSTRRRFGFTSRSSVIAPPCHDRGVGDVGNLLVRQFLELAQDQRLAPLDRQRRRPARLNLHNQQTHLVPDTSRSSLRQF